MPTSRDVRRALREIDARHHTTLELVDKAPGGMNGGGWFVADATGQRRVLKLGLGWPVDHLRRAARAVRSLRAEGYPTPAWIAVGTTRDGTRYLLQDFLDGEPGDPFTADKANQLVRLIEQHRGLDPWPERDWNAYVHGTLDQVRQRVRAEIPQAHDLLARLDRVRPVTLPAGDLVHGDLNSCNVLFEHGQLRGAIDIEALGSGCRVVDYAWLLREAYAEGSTDPEIFRVVRTAAERVAGEQALAMCLVVASCDLLLWMAEHLPDSVEEILPGLSSLADDFL